MTPQPESPAAVESGGRSLKEVPMHYATMYCSGCDHDVRVLMTDDAVHDSQANVPDPELVCLEIGEWCTGSLCPLGAAEPNAMVARLVRSGLPLDGLVLARGWCDVCERESHLALYGSTMAACTVCGTTRERGDELRL